MDDERLMDGNLYQVKYRWQGLEYATVLEAQSQEEAESEFMRENPQVETVQN